MVESRSAILVASLKVVLPYHMVVEIGVGGSVASAGCFPFVVRLCLLTFMFFLLCFNAGP